MAVGTGPGPTGPGGPARPVIVKLGGSILTRKREVERLRPKLLERLARELASGAGPRIVLHGAGGFGHRDAARWGLARAPDGPADRRTRLRHAALVQAEVRRLHGRVLAALLSAGVSAISVPVSLLAENRAGVLARFDATPFARVLGEGAVPVAFGDVVPDSVWGRSILSADTIAVALVHTVGASRAIFVSDVPGVLADPRRASSVLPEISPEAIASLALPGRGAPDVTGGIRGKAASMLAIAALGVDAGLISGLSDGSLARALRGEAVYGSWARAAAPGRAAPSPVADERP